MSNPEHVELVKQGYEVWNQWCQENQGEYPTIFRADFSSANLSGIDLYRCFLHHANFNDAILIDADLLAAELCSAHLIGANLSGANLAYTQLAGVDLSKANLSGANLSGAYLKGANLFGADLSSATLNGANLTETEFNLTLLNQTDFTNAQTYKTRFISNDLSVARNLETVKHGGPSLIEVDTLMRSHGQIPDSFLRGCGVAEPLIAILQESLVKPVESPRYYIVYSEEDRDFAHYLHDYLQLHGIRCWFDSREPGRERIGTRGMINAWETVIFCASGSSLQSGFIDYDIQRAFSNETRLWNNHQQKAPALLVLDLDGYISHDWKHEQDKAIRSRIIANCIGWQNGGAYLESKLAAVLTALRNGSGGEVALIHRDY